MLNSIRSRNLNCDQEAKFIQERITSVEKNTAELCHVFGEYSRKAARLRDKGDELARVTVTYAEYEDINKSLSNGLYNFSNCMSAISDYGDMRVQNIDSKVVTGLSRYETICKHAKDEVKQIYAAREKEMQRKKQLDRVRERNPRNRQLVVKAETELVKATAEVSRTIHTLEEQMTTFERQKLHDTKEILLDFIITEIGYHAKSLEILTKAYQDVNSVNEDTDLQDFQKIREEMESEFKKSLRLPETIPHSNAKQSLFRASHSLGSISTLFSTPQKKKTAGIPNTMYGNNENKSKSEETLDSLKRSISDTEESSSEDNDSTHNSSEPSSPPVIRKYTN